MSNKFWEEIEPLEGQNWLTKKIKGEGYLEFQGHLRFSGEWKGSIFSKDPKSHLLFLPESTMKGMITVERLTAQGNMEGIEIYAKYLKVEKGAKIKGRVVVQYLEVQEGAHFDADIEYIGS